MAKLKITDGEGLGKYLYEMLSDKDLRKKFKADPKAELAQFVELLDPTKKWEDVTIIPHFDKENDINLIIPWLGDIQQTLDEIEHSTLLKPAYGYPDYCTPGNPNYVDPEAGKTLPARKKSRLRAYYFRLSDYIMTRCK